MIFLTIFFFIAILFYPVYLISMTISYLLWMRKRKQHIKLNVQYGDIQNPILAGETFVQYLRDINGFQGLDYGLVVVTKETVEQFHKQAWIPDFKNSDLVDFKFTIKRQVQNTVEFNNIKFLKSDLDQLDQNYKLELTLKQKGR